MSSGRWQSELRMSLAPALLATLATWRLVSLCPRRQVISKSTPFLFARSASSLVKFPGWARISISELRAVLLVPFNTGSTGDSPWATIIFMPCLRAYLVRRGKCSNGIWVNSMPGKTLILFLGQFLQKKVISFTTRSILEMSTWSVMAMALKPFSSYRRASSEGKRQPSLSNEWVWRSIIYSRIWRNSLREINGNMLTRNWLFRLNNEFPSISTDFNLFPKISFSINVKCPRAGSNLRHQV